MVTSGQDSLLTDELVRCHIDTGDREEILGATMLHGWFNDQTECYDRFIGTLDPEVLERWHLSEAHLARLKDHHRRIYPELKRIARREGGVHKLPGMLRNFAWWATCVFRAAQEVGGLDRLLHGLETVEEAHARFKPWFVPGGRTNLPRILNAADAARYLADRGLLVREKRPLLARGALRGAAIIVDRRDVLDRDHAERLYPDEESRTALEERAAAYVRARFGDDARMDLAENWFCEAVHKRIPERRA